MTDLVKTGGIDPSDMMVPASGKQSTTTAITPAKKGRGKKVKDVNLETVKVETTSQAQNLTPSGNSVADGAVALVRGIGQQSRIAATEAMNQEIIATVQHVGAMADGYGQTLLDMAQQQFGVVLEDAND